MEFVVFHVFARRQTKFDFFLFLDAVAFFFDRPGLPDPPRKQPSLFSPFLPSAYLFFMI